VDEPVTAVEPQPLDKGLLRRAGFAGTGVALAVLWIASGISDSVAFPPTALAGRIIRSTPGDIATFFIEALGHWALRLLAIGAFIAALILGSFILEWTARGRRARPDIAAYILVVVAGLSSLVQPGDTMDLLPMAIALPLAGAAYVGVVRLITNVGEPEPAEVDLGRRQALRMGFGGAVALALSGGVVGWLVRKARGPDRNVDLVAAASPAPTPVAGDFPKIEGLSPEVTSAARHYVVDIDLVKPSVEAPGWTLPVTGEVDNPLKLTFASLQESFEVVEDYSVLTCISNEVGGPLIGHSKWGGVRLADVLNEAGVRDGVVDLIFRAADGYSDSIPLEIAMDPRVLLAVSQNGEPLTQEHGFPCRVRVPPIYGMKNVKWLTSIEAVDSDYKGYWMQRGWSDKAIIKTESRIDVAGREGSAVAGEATWIAGVAWAGVRGVEKVEVTTDGGKTWSEAELKDPISEVSWRLWAYRWTPDSAGRVTIGCRATDGDGVTQTKEVANPHPSGASGYHFVDVEVTA
jgi:DMSO/TMAO reductase YedYZ molybdopterin-dependent catalytic subunit